MNSKVSIIIPTYNRAEFLLDALESLHYQTKMPYEVIVVDDGSTDNTHKVISESDFKINYIVQKNSGPAAARNTGITAAKGDIFAFLDDDDLLLPHALELCVRDLEKKAAFGVDIVFGKVRPVEKVKKTQGGFTYRKILPAWPNRSLFCAVLKRKIFDRVGLFDQTLLLNEDTDWFLRAREKDTRFSLLYQETYLRRIHENNRTKNKAEANIFLLNVIKKSLARREKAGAGIASPLAQLSDFLY